MGKISAKKQNEMIQKEIKNLRVKFKEISVNKRVIAFKLIDRIAFMTITLQILESNIKLKGPVILMENGKQKMMIENPAQKSYNTMINRYTGAMEKLTNLLPKEPEISPESIKNLDNFDAFVQKRGD